MIELISQLHYMVYLLLTIILYKLLFTNYCKDLAAYSAFFVGGNLIESPRVVSGLSTFPAVAANGNPSAPIIDNYAFHTLFR